MFFNASARNRTGILMKRLVLFVALLAACFAWANPAQQKMLGAEYDYVACNAQFAHDYVAMKDNCALVHEVPVMDSSGYLRRIDDALSDAQGALNDSDGIGFGAAMWTARTEMLALGLATVGDAFQNKSVGFFNCVQNRTAPLKEDLDTCRASAFDKGKEAAHEYLADELDEGNGEVAGLQAMGADTMRMERILEYGQELDGDINSTFDTHDTAQVDKLYQKNTRLILLFRLEKMISVMNYAEPIIDAGNNGNKEQLLEKIADLRGDTEGLADYCAYSSDVGTGYALKNGECWNDGLALMARFNALQALYWAGR